MLSLESAEKNFGIVNRCSLSCDNFIGKLDVTLPLVTEEFLQNTVDVITSVTYTTVDAITFIIR